MIARCRIVGSGTIKEDLGRSGISKDDREQSEIAIRNCHNCHRDQGVKLNLSLRNLLLVPFLLQVSAAIGLTIWLFYTSERIILNLALRIAEATSEEVEVYLTDYLKPVPQAHSAIRQAVAMQLFDLRNFEVAERYFVWHMRNLNVDYINFGTPEGDFLGVERLETVAATETATIAQPPSPTNTQNTRTTKTHAIDTNTVNPPNPPNTSTAKNDDTNTPATQPPATQPPATQPNTGHAKATPTTAEQLAQNSLNLDQFNIVVDPYDGALGVESTYSVNAQGRRDRLMAQAQNDQRRDHRNEDWYKTVATVDDTRSRWSDIYSWVDKPDVLSISMSSRIYDGETFIGVLGVDRVISRIDTFLRQGIQASYNDVPFTVFLIEADGTLVATSTPTSVVNVKTVNGKPIADRRQAIESPDILIRESIAAIQAHAAAHEAVPDGAVISPSPARILLNPAQDAAKSPAEASAQASAKSPTPSLDSPSLDSPSLDNTTENTPIDTPPIELLNWDKLDNLIPATLNGERYLIQVSPVVVDGLPLGWKTVVLMPERAFLAESRANMRLVLGVCFLAISLTAGVGSLSAYCIAKTSHKLVDVSSAIARGKFEQRVGSLALPLGKLHYLSIRELNFLGHTFDRMATQLGEAFNNLEDKVKRRTAQLETEKQKVESLLLNILPEPIAQKLQQHEGIAIADEFREVTILFADIVGFTNISTTLPPKQLVEMLNEIFSQFDSLTHTYGLEKIKTIGDAYMVAGGIPIERSDHAQAIARLAIAMLEVIQDFNAKHQTNLSIRVGINTGSVIAGVIGKKKFAYDLWSDAVNTASRMESHSEPGRIQVTEQTYQYLRHDFDFEPRGMITVKGKGEMMTYWLLGGGSLPIKNGDQCAHSVDE